MKLSIKIGILLAVVACTPTHTNNGSDRKTASEAEDRARLEQMELEILAIIGDAECGDAAECRTIAFGAKPCGGPWRYLVYSAVDVDMDLLHQKVAEYYALNRDMNQKYGYFSDCMVAAQPTVGCVDGKCGKIARDRVAR